MDVIPDFAGATIRRFVARNIAVGATVYTDGLKSFEGLPASGYKHVPRSQPTQLRLRQGTLLGLGTGRAPTPSRRIRGAKDLQRLAHDG